MKELELLRDLIKIPSPSGEEREIGLYIARRLKKNFKIKLQKIGDRFNILAYKGEPKIILSSHLDTIPKQLAISEDENYIYGRGSCDAKASLASMIIAGERLIQKRINNFGLLFDVSEETDFSGIKKAINQLNPRYVIVGEPTDLKAVIGQKGLLGIKIKCYGKSAPGSNPEKGISAINKLINILYKLNAKFPKDTSINIGKISGGSAANVISDYAEAVIEFRTIRENKEILKVLGEQNIEFEIIYNYDPIMLKDLSLVQAFGFETEIVSYFTEMYFWAQKAKTIVFGPGKYEFAHSDNERIEKECLEKATQKYIKMVTYLNQNQLNKSKKEAIK